MPVVVAAVLVSLGAGARASKAAVALFADAGAQAAALDSARLVPQEDEVCAARWMPLAEYLAMPWLQSRPLWSQVARDNFRAQRS